MRTLIIPLIVGVASCSIQPSPTNVEAAGPASGGEVITVQLSNFAFDPDEIRLKAGVPVRLRLVNARVLSHLVPFVAQCTGLIR